MKEWFQQNRWLGTFLIVLAGATLIALILLYMAKGSFEQASARYSEASAERSRLERLDPFPNDANYKKMKVFVESYKDALEKFKVDLKTHALPVPADLPPNEFQTRLRQVTTETIEKARGANVKLPDNFFLGFDEYTAALPNTAATPLLGQELAQVQMLMNIVIDSRVDSVTVFKRTPLPEERSAAPSPSPAPGRKPAEPAASGLKLLERHIVDITFVGSPSAARKAINQISSAGEQVYIIRTLRVLNEKLKGPERDQRPSGSAPAASSPAPSAEAAQPASKQGSALNFMVGNEHIEVAAKIEIVRFTY